MAVKKGNLKCVVCGHFIRSHTPFCGALDAAGDTCECSGVSELLSPAQIEEMQTAIKGWAETDWAGTKFEIFPTKTLTDYAKECHAANKKWWTDLETGHYPLKRNMGELLMLCTSELAEAMEGDRKGLKDDKLPHRDMIDVELVDCFIRIADLMGARGIDFEAIYQEKMAYNAQRADHKPENRKQAGGKKY